MVCNVPKRRQREGIEMDQEGEDIFKEICSSSHLSKVSSMLLCCIRNALQ